ncbi:hypothetical protein Rt10032_c08g3654 [Rhodotorula toruloides]|uniref:Transglycosylase SLT domain-containing protein n=1 Tax=Rhodotorula toruloides TaxID=5286 RepID=A0A511KGZ8_RHOTO|nr:hypothetical protein Rt10032_c08g3654 [Rhodotorula toruloides]
MHLSLALTLAAAASTVASARFDRPHARRSARSHHSLSRREPFRYFAPPEGVARAAPQSFAVSFDAKEGKEEEERFELPEGIVALRKRDIELPAVFDQIGNVVGQIGTAMKLAMPIKLASNDKTASTSKKEDSAQIKATAAQRKKKAAVKAKEEAAAKAEAEAEKQAQEAAHAKELAATKAKAVEKEKKRQAKLAAKNLAAKKRTRVEAKAAEEAAAKAAAKKKAKGEAAAAKKIAEKAKQEKAAAAKKAAEQKKAQEQKQAAEAAAKIAVAKAAAEKKKTDEAAAKKTAADKAGADKAAAEKTVSGNRHADASSGSQLAAAGGKNSVSLIGFHSPDCGPSGATEENPNGSESFLNCGISKSSPDSGWTPPQGVTLDRITTVSIEHALVTNPVWEPCKPFIPLFEKIGKETGLPPTLLAAFALQESTCNPNVLGDNGGAFGLMQITKDKCGGRDNHGCAEPEYNVRTAANYFKKQLEGQGGEFLVALGAYNGWYKSMSFNSATAKADTTACVQQQNLDYLTQMLNGWLMGRTGYELGSYKNLAVCDNQ